MILGAHEEGINAADIEVTIESLFADRFGGVPVFFEPVRLFGLYAALPEKFRQQAKLGPIQAPAATMDERVRSIVRTSLRLGGFRDKNYVDPYPSEGWVPDSIHGEKRVPERYLTGPFPQDVVIELTHEQRNSFVGGFYDANGGREAVTELLTAEQLASFYLHIKEYRSKPNIEHVMLVPSERVTLKISLPGLEVAAIFVTAGQALTDGFVTHDRLPPAARAALRNAIAKGGG